MENEGGNNNDQSRNNNQCRRNWSEHEEETLLIILEELVVAGNKGDNGTFKAGTHEEACKMMKIKIYGIAINVKQVVNKMKRWLTKLNEVVDMMNTSGFGWDDTRKCVTCDCSQVLSEYLEKHPKVGNHVNKEFKEFERLQGIFGKDRATGQRAEGVADATENEITENLIDDDEDLLQQHDNSPASIGNITIRTGNYSTGPPPKRQGLSPRFLEGFDSNMDAMRTDFSKVLVKFPNPSKRDLA